MPIEEGIHDLNGVPTTYFYPRVNSGYKQQKVVQKASDFDVPLRSDVEYYIDGVVDLAGQTLFVGSGGAYFHGYNFDLSRLIDSTDNATMIMSSVGGSGNILVHDMSFEATGANSKVWDLVDHNNFSAIELFQVNYNDCTSLGSITNYRQGLETGTGRFGGSPSLELKGTWAGGFRITTSIVRVLDSAMTEPLFKAGAGFTMASRFLTDINCDLPALAAFFDAAPSNFPNPSTLQVNSAIFTRDGVSNSDDTNIFPNITRSDLPSSFVNTQGIRNTYVGGRLTVSSENLTTISAGSTYYPINGIWGSSQLQHFDTPSAGQLRHLGNNPREFKLIGDLSIQGTRNNELQVRVAKYDFSAATTVYPGSQRREVNNLAGGRDVAFFNLNINVELDQNDYIYLEIANNSGNANITLELDSYFIIEERA